MKLSRSRHKGFTLVELLIVIAIITLLIAIAMPIMTRAREKARQTSCMANLHSIQMAIRMYRIDEGASPGPYDPVSGQGGMNALYPQYLESRKALVCSSDRRSNSRSYIETYADLLSTSGNMYRWQDAGLFSEHYSSYNAYYNWVGYVYFWPPSGSGDIPSKTYPQLGGGTTLPLQWGDNIAAVYMYYRYVHNYPWYYAYYVAQQIYWSGYASANPGDSTRFKDALGRPMWELADPNWYPFGQPSGSFPGLINRNAPDNTIITRCHHHRRYTIARIPAGTATGRGSQMVLNPESEMELEESPRDIVLRLDGSAELEPVLSFNWAIQPR